MLLDKVLAFVSRLVKAWKIKSVVPLSWRWCWNVAGLCSNVWVGRA